jgi:hypothetical protein
MFDLNHLVDLNSIRIFKSAASSSNSSTNSLLQVSRGEFIQTEASMCVVWMRIDNFSACL